MAVELPDLRYIANLTFAQIRSGLADADLIRIIRSVDYPFAGKERLEFFDRDTLERVVCLVRRWSQNRIAARQETSHSALDDGPSFRIPSFHAASRSSSRVGIARKSLPDLTSTFVNASHGMPRLCSSVIP